MIGNRNLFCGEVSKMNSRKVENYDKIKCRNGRGWCTKALKFNFENMYNVESEYWILVVLEWALISGENQLAGLKLEWEWNLMQVNGVTKNKKRIELVWDKESEREVSWYEASDIFCGSKREHRTRKAVDMDIGGTLLLLSSGVTVQEY